MCSGIRTAALALRQEYEEKSFELATVLTPDSGANVRARRDAADASAWSPEHSETAAGSCGRVQPGVADAQAGGHWQAEVFAGCCAAHLSRHSVLLAGSVARVQPFRGRVVCSGRLVSRTRDLSVTHHADARSDFCHGLLAPCPDHNAKPWIDLSPRRQERQVQGLLCVLGAFVVS